MNTQNKEICVTTATRQKVQSAKLYIERRYSKLIQQQREKKLNWELLYKKMISLELNQLQQEEIKRNILHKQAQKLRNYRKKITINDFQTIKIIGKGAFGQVRLCEWKQFQEPVAIKKMNKKQMINRNKIIQARQQKDILAKTVANQWIVQLKCSFQDEKNLYLVMQYLPGGDLMNLLIKKDILKEQQAKFYLAEMLLALEAVHDLNYIHRDLKPDNVLIDSEGHIKLSDFGLCKNTQIRPKKLNEKIYLQCSSSKSKLKITDFHNNYIRQNYRRNRKLAYSAVGTPDYVAPQVQKKSGYTQTADWWSLGVILYQMVVGYPPFVSQEPSITWHKIQNWKKYLTIPKQSNLHPFTIDLIKKLITDEKDRIGNKGIQQIKNHPFFSGVDWNGIRKSKAPIIPQLNSFYDTQNFDQFQPGQQWKVEIEKTKNKKRKDVDFIGYTFKNNNTKSHLLKALLDLDVISPNFVLKKHKKSFQNSQKKQMSSEARSFFTKKQNIIQSPLKQQNGLIKSMQTINSFRTPMKAQLNEKITRQQIQSPKNNLIKPNILMKVINEKQNSPTFLKQMNSSKKIPPVKINYLNQFPKKK